MKEKNIIVSSSRHKRLEKEAERALNRIRIYLDEEVDRKDASDGCIDIYSYEMRSIEFLGDPSYGELVSLLIHSRYTDDEMQAIAFNHMMDDADAEHKAEYEELQCFRSEAKALAKEIMVYLKESE